MNRISAIMSVQTAKAFLFLSNPIVNRFEDFCAAHSYEVDSTQLDMVLEWREVSRALVEKMETYLELTRKSPKRRKDYEVFRIQALERDITSLTERLQRLQG